MKPDETLFDGPLGKVIAEGEFEESALEIHCGKKVILVRGFSYRNWATVSGRALARRLAKARNAEEFWEVLRNYVHQMDKQGKEIDIIMETL